MYEETLTFAIASQMCKNKKCYSVTFFTEIETVKSDFVIE
jgi:hypothetical protein